jgi:hypothetical protein
MMNRFRLSFARLDVGLLLALLLPLLAVMPLLTHPGLPNTADGPAHLMRQVELNQAWAEGNFYPRWGADLALGHGMPIFSYAPPMLYQATQLLHLTGLPLDSAMKGVVALGFLLYSAGMFLFARRVYGDYPALVAAAVYVYAPYRLREAYIQGNYGQFLGLAFYPLIFWAFHGLITADRPRYRIFAPLALAGLLFSHNISFMLFGPIFAAYLLFLLGQPAAIPRAAALGRTMVAGLLGLGLAAIFWLPAFGERHDIKLEGITQGFFDFRENFITVPQFLAAPLPLDLSAINPAFPLSLGLAQIIGAALGLAALLWLLARWATRRPSNPTLPHTLFFAGFLLLYAFLAVPWSQPVWENLPLLELTEFPWRMLGPAIFCAAVLSAAAFAAIERRLAPHLIPLALASAGLLVIALNAYYLYPAQFIPWGTPTPADAFKYEVVSGAIGTTSTGEFLPRWAQQHPQPDTLWPDYEAGRPPQLIDPAALPPGASVTATAHRTESDSLRLDTPQPFTATLRRLYWPGWQVEIDGQPAPFEITPATGLIQTTIPAGPHNLTVRLGSTPLRTAGLWLSGLSLLVLAIIGLIVRRRPAPSTPPQTIPLKLLLPAAGLLLAVYLFSRPLAPLFTQHSDPNHPRPANRPLQIDFADQLRLVGADNWPETIALSPDQPSDLTVTLYWRALPALDANYAVFLHLDDPAGQTRATADEASPENIPTRNWPTGLYLRNPLHLQIPGDLPPIRYTLTAGWYNPATGERLPLADGSGDTVTLGPVWLTPASPPAAGPPLAAFGPVALHHASLDGNTLTLHWRTGQPIDRNYTIFVHVTDAAGNLLSQADGVPFDGLYPLPNWLPGQFITDRRTLALDERAAAVTIGLYLPDTGERLPALDATGQPLPEQSFSLTVQP